MCNVTELLTAKKRIKELEALLAPPLPPTLRGEITMAELRNLITLNFTGAQVFLSDSVKYLCDLKDIKTFLAQDKTNRRTYKKDKYDCDDFAYRLMGQFSVEGWAEITKGIIWTDTHALLGCIDVNRDFWFIEPQSDTIKSNLEPWQGTQVRLVMI